MGGQTIWAICLLNKRTNGQLSIKVQGHRKGHTIPQCFDHGLFFEVLMYPRIGAPTEVNGDVPLDVLLLMLVC